MGRKPEQSQLSDMLTSQQAEFLVLYGRRRVGKSFLIETFFKKKQCQFFHVTGLKDGRLKEQLAEFAKEIGRVFYQGATIASPESWMQALDALTRAMDNAAGSKKIVLFMDELPWLCTPKSRLIQALDYYWNRHWKNNSRIKLIVCGSSASWIIRKILHHKGGLHNRNTRTMLLRPFHLSETKVYVKALGLRLNDDQLMQIYMCFGGIPYYLNYLTKGKSAAQMIDAMCFQRNGILLHEFDKLFDSLFVHADEYKGLIRLIAQSREGLSRADIEAQNVSSQEGGLLTRRLKELEDASFIQALMPLGNKRKGLYYRVIDEYCYFYLRWIEPVKNTLLIQEDDNTYWSSQITSSKYHAWMGYTFESVCYKHAKAVRQGLGVPAGSLVGGWRHKPRKQDKGSGAQIDLVFDRPDGVVTLCEIKYTGKPFEITKDYAEELKRKMAVYKSVTKTRKQLQWMFIASNGVAENKYFYELVDGVMTLGELFS